MACNLKTFQLGVAPSKMQASTLNPILSSTPIASQTQVKSWSLLKTLEEKYPFGKLKCENLPLAIDANIWVARSPSFLENFLLSSNISSLMSPISVNPINVLVARLILSSSHQKMRSSLVNDISFLSIWFLQPIFQLCQKKSSHDICIAHIFWQCWQMW